MLTRFKPFHPHLNPTTNICINKLTLEQCKCIPSEEPMSTLLSLSTLIRLIYLLMMYFRKYNKVFQKIPQKFTMYLLSKKLFTSVFFLFTFFSTGYFSYLRQLSSDPPDGATVYCSICECSLFLIISWYQPLSRHSRPGEVSVLCFNSSY